MPLPDFSAEMSQIEDEKNAPSVEAVEENPEPVVEESLTEEEIFKKQKREKLLNHLAECRKLSAAKRKAQKEEKQKNKKPRGRPKKNPQEENVVLSEASPVQELPPPPATPVVKELPAKPHYPIPTDIDYDRIIDGVHQKYLKSKAERKAKKATVQPPTPTMVYQPPPPAQPAFNKSAFEAQVREDERNRIRGEVQRKKQEQEALKQRTKDYYSRLPPRSLAAGKNWDTYFFD